MNIEMYDQMTSVNFVDGTPVLSFYFSDAGPLEKKMHGFIQAILDQDQEMTEEVTLTIGAPLSEIVDGLIDGHRFLSRSDCVVMEPDCRPLVSAAKEALLVAIAKLDAIKFEAWEAQSDN